MLVLGVWIVYKGVTQRLGRDRNKPAELKIGDGFKLSIRGPAWLILIVLGILLIAAPIFAAVVQQKSQAPFAPPIQAQVVEPLKEPNYADFRFLKDLSYLDLRNSLVRPWYDYLPYWGRLAGHHRRVRPASLFNYMLIHKIGDAHEIHIDYSTSGLLDLRCLTDASYKVFTYYTDDQYVGEIVVDLGSVPKGSDFVLITEVTYWNAFSVNNEEDFTTYTHDQADQAEEMSVALIFPDAKPFKEISAEETPPAASEARQIQGPYASVDGLQNKTYYWSFTKAAAGKWFYTIKWKW
jgi:hypothetical protein